MMRFIVSVFCLVLCEGGFLNSVQGMDKASLAMRGCKRLYSQSCPSLSAFKPYTSLCLSLIYDRFGQSF